MLIESIHSDRFQDTLGQSQGHASHSSPPGPSITTAMAVHVCCSSNMWPRDMVGRGNKERWIKGAQDCMVEQGKKEGWLVVEAVPPGRTDSVKSSVGLSFLICK